MLLVYGMFVYTKKKKTNEQPKTNQPTNQINK